MMRPRSTTRLIRRLLACPRGHAAVEFVLIAPALLALLFGLIEVSRYFFTVNTIQFAMDEAGRWAMANTSATPTDVRAFALGKLSMLPIAEADIPTPTIDTVSGVEFITIQCCNSYQFESVANFIPLGTIQINVKSRVPLVD